MANIAVHSSTWESLIKAQKKELSNISLSWKLQNAIIKLTIGPQLLWQYIVAVLDHDTGMDDSNHKAKETMDIQRVSWKPVLSLQSAE